MPCVADMGTLAEPHGIADMHVFTATALRRQMLEVRPDADCACCAGHCTN